MATGIILPLPGSASDEAIRAAAEQFIANRNGVVAQSRTAEQAWQERQAKLRAQSTAENPPLPAELVELAKRIAYIGGIPRRAAELILKEIDAVKQRVAELEKHFEEAKSRSPNEDSPL